jgi:hypothetical protein
LGGAAGAAGAKGSGGAGGSCSGTICSKQCVDLNSDAYNCGKCGNVCPPGGTVTLVCQQGNCVCPGGETLCNGVCVDATRDNNNCGTCGTACSPFSGALTTCIGGSCTACYAWTGQTCSPGQACAAMGKVDGVCACGVNLKTGQQYPCCDPKCQ